MSIASPDIAEETASNTLQSYAIVNGETLSELPIDLYIPPSALRIFLESFQGPLDLLLYLIRKQNLDILDMPIAKITKQYMEYIELMDKLEFELAAEYLVMAATLAEIKSKTLLPRPTDAAEDEEDPRAELMRRLQEYERFKKAAGDLDELPRMGRDIFPASAQAPDMTIDKPQPHVELKDILFAIEQVMNRAKLQSHYQVQREMLSVRERMTLVLEAVQQHGFTDFVKLFVVNEGGMGVVVTLIALLELLKQAMVEVVQNEPYSQIHIKVVSDNTIN